MHKVQKEAENYKLLYSTSKQKFASAQEQLNIMSSSSDKL